VTDPSYFDQALVVVDVVADAVGAATAGARLPSPSIIALMIRICKFT